MYNVSAPLSVVLLDDSTVLHVESTADSFDLFIILTSSFGSGTSSDGLLSGSALSEGSLLSFGISRIFLGSADTILLCFALCPATYPPPTSITAANIQHIALITFFIPLPP